MKMFNSNDYDTTFLKQLLEIINSKSTAKLPEI